MKTQSENEFLEKARVASVSIPDSNDIKNYDSDFIKGNTHKYLRIPFRGF